MFLNSLVYMVESKDASVISPDTWINLVGTIIGAIIGGLIAFGVAKSQIKEQSFVDDKRERSTIILNFRLNTYLEIENLLNKYSKEVDKLHENLSKFYLGYISEKEYKKIFELDFDSKISGIKREINGRLILAPELIEKNNIVSMFYDIYSAMIYKHYEGEENELLDFLSSNSNEEVPDELNEIYKQYLEFPINEINNMYNNHTKSLDELTTEVFRLMKAPIEELME